ncbi:hypothetical protein KAI87_02520 [Myxococcota bacterium]|nr:hypothetical protein [Myxococcota bacterium]
METNEKFKIYRDFLIRIVQKKGGDSSAIVDEYPLPGSDGDSKTSGADKINMTALSPLLTGSGEDAS